MIGLKVTLNYKDGKITEAKAYLEQSPYVHHHYFDAYEQPVYVELTVKDEQNTLPLSAAMKWLSECEANRVGEVRIMGDVTNYEHIDRILSVCKRTSDSENGGTRAVVELCRGVSATWLEKIIEVGATDFIIDIVGARAKQPTLWTLKTLRGKGCINVRARWFMHRGNAEKISKVIRFAEKLGVKELIVTGMKPAKDEQIPTREQMLQVAETIKNWRAEHNAESDGEEKSAELSAEREQMELTVDGCFSPLRALMEGSDPKKNANRGVEHGCAAGRDHFCVLPTGKITPCAHLDQEEDCGSLAAYWNDSPALKKLRDNGDCAEHCKTCAYRRRCLPCPAVFSCPI